MVKTYEAPESTPLLNSDMTDAVVAAMPLARLWARRQLSNALVGLPMPGEIVSGTEAVSVLTTVRDHLVGRSQAMVKSYSSARWLWYLRRTDLSIVRGYLPNTETSVMRIAENLSGMSPFSPEEDTPFTTNPLAWTLDEAAVARLSRLLAIAELVNHSDGWLRRSSKNAKFQMVAKDFPDLVDDPQLEAAIDRFDERVIAAAANRWHPSLVDPTRDATEPLLLQVSMLRDGVGATPMWRGRIIDSPSLFTGEGRFALQFSSLTDQSNAEQMRGALDSMQQPETVAALVVLAQALMWHATWTAESFGISVPRVGYVLMLEAHLKERVEDILRLAGEHTWPAMEGHLPLDADTVLKSVEEMNQGGEMSSPGPIIRRWTGNTMMVDGHALSIELMHRLRIDPRTGGERVNESATDFELSVQALIDEAGLSPEQAIREGRGTTLRVSGSSITDIDAMMQVGPNLICISCKKFELGRPYDVGDYSSVRNAKTNVEAAVVEWAERMKEIDTQRVGDNFDLSPYEKLIGLVVTPELAFVDSPEALETVKLADGVDVPRYLSFGELACAIETLTSS